MLSYIRKFVATSTTEAVKLKFTQALANMEEETEHSSDLIGVPLAKGLSFDDLALLTELVGLKGPSASDAEIDTLLLLHPEFRRLYGVGKYYPGSRKLKASLAGFGLIDGVLMWLNPKTPGQRCVVLCEETWWFVSSYAALSCYAQAGHLANGGINTQAVMDTLASYFYATGNKREAITIGYVEELLRRQLPTTIAIASVNANNSSMGDSGTSFAGTSPETAGSAASASATSATSSSGQVSRSFSFPSVMQLVHRGMELVMTSRPGEAFYSLRGFVLSTAPRKLGWLDLVSLGNPMLRLHLATHVASTSPDGGGYLALLLPKSELNRTLAFIAYQRKEEVGIGVKADSAQAVYRTTDGVIVD